MGRGGVMDEHLQFQASELIVSACGLGLGLTISAKGPSCGCSATATDRCRHLGVSAEQHSTKGCLTISPV